MGPEWAWGVAVICVAFFGGVGILTRIADMGKKTKRLPDDVTERLGELDARLEALEQSQRRVAELEERVDFAERLLARQNEAERLEPPRH